MDLRGNSEEKGAHAWNYVYHSQEDKWYAVDVTWDNRKELKKLPTYNYFMVGKNTKIGNYLFSDNHIPGRKNYELQTYIPATPKLAEVEYEKFKGILKKSTNYKTNQPVTATATFNRQLKNAPNGWEISNDRKTITKKYLRNEINSYKIENTRGETTNLIVSVVNIDKVAPKVSTTYSEVNKTNKNILVTIKGNEQLQKIEGWSLSSDKKTLTRTYFTNTLQEVEVNDLAGNKTKVDIKIENIDKNSIQSTDSLVVDTIYSTRQITCNDVKVSIVSNMKLNEIEGWELSSDMNALTKIYTDNKNETILIKDENGREKEVEIQINNIDKTMPNLKVLYGEVNDNGEIMVTITSDKELIEKEGWTLSDNKKILTKLYNTSIEDDIFVEDLAGNRQIVNITINEQQLKPEDILLRTEGKQIMDSNSYAQYIEEKKSEQSTSTSLKNSNYVTEVEKATEKISEEESVKKITTELDSKNFDEKKNDNEKTIGTRQAKQIDNNGKKMYLPNTGKNIKVILLIIILFSLIGGLSYLRYKHINIK